MYQQYFAEISVNATGVLPQSTSVDGTADMHCLLIDRTKNENWPTPVFATMTCHVRADVLIKEIYILIWENTLRLVNLSPVILSFDITISFPDGHFSNNCRRYFYHFVVLPSNKR